MGACSHCECEVYRGDPFVITLSEKMLHTGCIQPHFERLRQATETSADQPAYFIVGDESPF